MTGRKILSASLFLLIMASCLAGGVPVSVCPAQGAGQDTLGPQAIRNLKAVTGNGKITLSWDNPGDSGFYGTGIRILIGKNLIADTVVPAPANRFIQWRGRNITTYTYAVRALGRTKSACPESRVAACFIETGLPVLSINTGNRHIAGNKKTWMTGTLSIANADPGSCADEIPLSVRRRGNTGWGMPKPSLAIKLDRNRSMPGMSEHKSWVLLANYSDKTLLRNDLAFHLGRAVFGNMKWTPGSQHVQLIINNEYMGEYLLAEQIRMDEKRLNIAGIDKVKYGGYLLEVDFHKDELYGFTTPRGVSFLLKDPDKDAGLFNEPVFQTIQSYVRKVEDALYSDGFTRKNRGYRKYIDVDSFIDWYLVNEIMKNNDAVFHSSCYMYYDPSDRKMHMGPLWDFDISCGNINYNGCDTAGGFWVMRAPWIKQMFADPAFVKAVKKRWREKKAALVEAIGNYIDSQSAYLAKEQELNFYRWQVLGRYVWPNAKGYDNRRTYRSEVDYLKDFLFLRIEWLDSAFAGL